MSDDKKFYTVADLAKILKISPLTVRKAVREGRIKAVRLGSSSKAQMRFNEEEVDRILKEGLP